ncbi:MAG: fumarylacetoacetate hydrolase family protein [Gammaproteobacteria bacterium]|nr:fumarylacetoacetate hydrolase family protein [Gammaproteobacteria bacterium]
MKLASLKDGSRDGRLVVVSRDLSKAAAATDIATTLQQALDRWQESEPLLRARAEELESGQARETFSFDARQAAAPLPRAYHWADGSAYVTHVELVRRARGAELPDSYWSDPLMYMGASDAFLGAHDDIPAESEAWGIDFEAEIAVITDDVPAGVNAKQAAGHIQLLALVNDVSLRNLIPAELAKQFGFYQSKPHTAFSPVAVTPDELGEAWDGARLHRRVLSHLNGTRIGHPDAGADMTFGFPELIAHAARTRSLMAGTVVGSGTVSNKGSADGSSCLAEVRSLETIRDGKPSTPYLSFGDRVRIDMLDDRGATIMGAIDQVVVRYQPPRD